MDRFLQHVLPKGFCKVRYYGFFSPRQRTTLQTVRGLVRTGDEGVRRNRTTRSGCARARRPALPPSAARS